MARATAKTRAPKRPSKRRPAVKRAPVKRTPDVRQRARDAFDGLEQRHYDLIGLVMVALGVYIGVRALSRLGRWGCRAMAFIRARVHGGPGRLRRAVDGLRPGPGADRQADDPAPRALNAGALLVLLALLLAFAAGTLGLGPDKPVRHGYFEPDFFRTHGGAIGESLYWASTTLFQRLGAQILAVLMLMSGILLLTGMTIANLVQSAGAATRRASGATADVARAARNNSLPSSLPGWDEPDDVDIQITRANETEVLANEPIWEEPEDVNRRGRACKRRG